MADPVAVAVTNGDLGGGETMALRYAEAARSLGHAVTVIGPSEPAELVDAAATAGFSVVRIRAADRRAYVRRLRAWDRRERQGMLWAHGLLPALATAGHRSRLVHLHQDPRGAGQRAAYRVARMGAEAVLVPSTAMAARLPGTTPVPNWTEAPTDAATGPGGRDRPQPAVLGFLGRLSQDKGLDVLARAVLPLVRAGRARLLVAGDSRHVPADQARAVHTALAALGDGVEVVGHVPRDEFFAQVDLAVFPSVWAEPFGLVVAEAMAARVPFVVSDAGALAEVAGREHPWVARSDDPDDLARVLEAALAASPADVAVAVASARARWEAEFSPAAGLERVRGVLTRGVP